MIEERITPLVIPDETNRISRALPMTRPDKAGVESYSRFSFAGRPAVYLRMHGAE
jgi:hypothetical protein